MPYVQAGDVRLHYIEHGRGDNVVVFMHGNLGCAQWMDLILPRLPEDVHVYAFDWRGCGGSDKPEPSDDYANYAMPVHARDLLNALDALGIERCDLANHSTGAIICDYALLEAPERFGKVLALDPVTPKSLPFDEQGMQLFEAMKADPQIAYAGLATAAPSLFEPESLAPGEAPRFLADTSDEQRQAFATVVEKTRELSDGIWFGTPVQLTREFESGALAAQQERITHPHLVLWGEQDYWIPRADIDEMVARKPHCELKTLPGVGHAMNIEAPDEFARIFTEYFT